MPAPQVSLVIATHRRVDALSCTLRALLLQTHADWTALVIGDRCGEETAEAIRTLREPRIRYYNLPQRFGEQSGPNTAGLHLVEGDFVAFLNHDDLPLPDHLAHALDRLCAHDADFFIGRFANATQLERTHAGTLVPVFTEIRPRHETLDVLATANPWFFDPSSFWVIRTSYARAVGAWRPAVRLWRTPLRDWLMRAWRRGGGFCFGDRVTGLRFLTHNLREGSPLYAHTTPEHESMLERMQIESADAIRAFIEEQLARAPPPVPVPPATLQVAILSSLYRRLGVDAVSLIDRLSRRPRGEVLAWITCKRTGEALPARPTIRDFLRDPEACRVV